MSLANEMTKLVDILDQKSAFFIQRIQAVTSGNMGKARFIENCVYPEFNKRIQTQIQQINSLMKTINESEGYDKARQAN